MVAPSIEIGPSGTLKLFKSFQEYEFNNTGMKRNTMTSPLATGASSLQQSYQVRYAAKPRSLAFPWQLLVSPPSSPLYLPQIAEKDVRFVRTLGQGASGLVQKAFWPAKAEFVAVKKISILEREKRHQLMNDIKALCNVPDVPGLIRFRGAYHCADRGQIAVALEYMDGGSLADVLEKVGKIPEDVLSAMTRRVLQGLAYLHANHTVHRDIKPANILMSTSGEPKVSDFGISAFVDNTIAQCHTFLGTVTYMSPERINGQPYSFPADIWALGLALVECATGRYPYDASGGTIPLMIQLMEEECPLPMDATFSAEFQDFVRKCMAKDPMRRPTAEDLLRHPFITAAPPVDLKAFMRCMYDPKEKAADAAAVVTARFYNNLSYNWADSDSIAAFYAADVALSTGPAGAEPGSTAVARMKGKYTVAAHFHDMMEQLAGEVGFTIVRQQHKRRALGPKDAAQGPLQMKAQGESRVSGELLVISQRIVVRDEAPLPGAASDVLGEFEEVMAVQVTAMDELAPGTGFVVVGQDVRWVRPLLVRRPAKDPSSAVTPPKCRQQ